METDIYTEYDRQADGFLSKHRFSIHAEWLSFERPEWLEEGHPIGERYNVYITRLDDDEVIEFKFWSSYNDAKAGIRPSNYHVLACVSNNAYAPTDADGVLSEYGEDMKRSQAEDVAKEAVRLQLFFNEEELRDLAEII